MKHPTRKKILCFLYLWIVLLLGFAPQPEGFSAPAKAATPDVGSYACILEENTFFYSTPDESRGLFLLPRTYYVALVEYGAEYCKVEYLYDDTQVKKLVGYAKTERLTFVDYLPKRPYFYHVFELTYQADESAPPRDDFLTQIKMTCAYYGDYKIGSKTYCYVLREGEFGYVPKPANLTVKENTEYAEHFAQTPPSSPQTSSAEKKSSPAQIAILVALCLLVPVLAALILKPPRRPPYELDE